MKIIQYDDVIFVRTIIALVLCILNARFFSRVHGRNYAMQAEAGARHKPSLVITLHYKHVKTYNTLTI